MRAVIFCGGDIMDYESAGARIGENDLIICADSGYKHAKRLGLCVDVALGDFDSYDASDVICENILTYPAKKDYTDGEIAVRYALERGYSDILILGAMGGRIDHTLGNIYLLKFILEQGGTGELYDGVSKVIMAGEGEVFFDGKKGDILSVIPFAEADCFTTDGLEYPLERQSLAGASTGLSNVFIKERVCVKIGSGRAVIVHTKKD